jgi:radical SAM protein (TIGR01212 family)
MLYNNLSGYLRKKYGQRLKKICIDGGFTCPNRDGKCGTGGCIFCGERGAGEHIDPKDGIGAQVRKGLEDASQSDLFVAYFQNFTNTYAPIEVLKERYDAALIDERIRILAIGTRPDCIDEETAGLIAKYKKDRDVWVELGLQTASDRTADLINRGYHRDKFEEAMGILDKYGIPVCVHLIIGLPGEGLDEIKQTCNYLAKFNIFGIKIHSIFVMRGTGLEEKYLAGEYTPPTLYEYLDGCCYILTHISPDIVVHRLTGDCSSDMLVAPEWNCDKHDLIEKIRARLEGAGERQGCHFGEK